MTVSVSVSVSVIAGEVPLTYARQQRPGAGTLWGRCFGNGRRGCSTNAEAIKSQAHHPHPHPHPGNTKTRIGTMQGKGRHTSQGIHHRLLPHFLPSYAILSSSSTPPTMSSRWDAAPQQQAGASTSASGSGSGSPPAAASNTDPAAAAAAAAARIAASYGVGSSTAPSSQALTTLKSQSNGGAPTDKRREGNEAPFNEFVDVSMPCSHHAAIPSTA